MQRPSSDRRQPDVDYLAIMRGMWRRYKALVAVIFLAITAPGLLLLYFTAVPLYVSRGTISIEPAALSQIPFVSAPSRQDTIATHLVLLRSRSLSEAVLEALPAESLDELLTQPQHTDYLTMVRNWIARLQGEPPTVISPRERALQELRMARMDFSPAKEAGHAFVITATATRPRVAMDLVTTHIQVLLNRARSVDREESRRARDFLEAQYQQTKESLARAEGAVAKLQDKKGRLPSGGETDLELTRLVQLENALAETQANQQVLGTRREGLQKALSQARTRDAGSWPGIVIDEDQARLNAFKAAQDQLAKLEAKLSTLRERYTDAHPQVQSTQEEITSQQTKIAQMARQLPVAPRAKAATPAELLAQLTALDKELDALATREETLKLQVGRLRGNMRSVSLEDREFGNLLRSVATNRNLATVLSERLMAAKIREQGDSSVIRVVDSASRPTQTTTNKTQRLALMILGLAGSMAFGVAFGIEFLRRPVETETDIRNATGLRILGSVGIMEKSTPVNGAQRNGRPILLPVHPAGPKLPQNGPVHVELYRAILANIETERLKSQFRSILVTSPGPSEGKSTTLLNLAHAFQEFGRRVLVVDADLRRPSLSAPLALTNRMGIVDLLLGNATFEQACRQLPSGVTVIPGQVARGNPVSLLASARCKELLRMASTQFDLILIDSAPVLAVPDNILFGTMVDWVLLVVKATGTSIRDLRKAQEVVEKAGGRLLGVVLNQANPRDVPYYHPRYRKYYMSGTGNPVTHRQAERGEGRQKSR